MERDLHRRRSRAPLPALAGLLLAGLVAAGLTVLAVARAGDDPGPTPSASSASSVGSADGAGTATAAPTPSAAAGAPDGDASDDGVPDDEDPGPPVPADGPEPAAGPVIVVPGYGGQTALLGGLIEALRADGRTVRLMTSLGSATQDLRRQAALLDEEVTDALAGGAPSVDVIGFSAGGLVTRLWAEDGGTAQLRRVVTIGTPHHGTEVASFASVVLPQECPRACHQLLPGSPLLRSLEDRAPGPGWVSVWTRDDRISAPARTAVLPGAVSVPVQDLCPGVIVPHGDLPRTGFVVRLVVDLLDGAAPATAPPTSPDGPCP